MIQIRFWNLLADGLSSNEFMTNGGDLVNVNWETRSEYIIEKLALELHKGAIILCVEVDRFHYILKK